MNKKIIIFPAIFLVLIVGALFIFNPFKENQINEFKPDVKIIEEKNTKEGIVYIIEDKENKLVEVNRNSYLIEGEHNTYQDNYDNGDGTGRFISYASERNVYEDGGWKRIENARSLNNYKGFGTIENDNRYGYKINEWNESSINITALIYSDETKVPFKINGIIIKNLRNNEQIIINNLNVLNSNFTIGEHSTTFSINQSGGGFGFVGPSSYLNARNATNFTELNTGCSVGIRNLGGANDYYICRTILNFSMSLLPPNRAINYANLSLYLKYVEGVESTTSNPFNITAKNFSIVGTDMSINGNYKNFEGWQDGLIHYSGRNLTYSENAKTFTLDSWFNLTLTPDGLNQINFSQGKDFQMILMDDNDINATVLALGTQQYIGFGDMVFFLPPYLEVSYGDVVQSNPITTMGINNLRLNSTYGTNLTTENLSVSFTPITNQTLNTERANISFILNLDKTYGLGQGLVFGWHGGNESDYISNNNMSAERRGTGLGLTQGYLGNGTLFNLTSYINTTSYSDELNLPNGGTICAWIFPVTLGGGSLGRIVDKSTTATGTNGYHIRMSATNSITLAVNAGTTTVSNTNAVKLNQWNDVCVQFNSTGRAIYVNGTYTVASGGTITTLPPNTFINFSIGIAPRVATTNFDGIIDELHIWNRSLSTAEIQQLYNIGVGSRFMDVPLTNNTFSQIVLNYKNTTKKDIWYAQLYISNVSVREKIAFFQTNNLTILNSPPATPTLNLPIDNLYTNNYTVNLSILNSSDPDGDAVNYDIYIGNTNPPTTSVSNLTNRSVIYSFPTSGNYYWRAMANDNYSGSSYTSTRNIEVDWRFLLVNQSYYINPAISDSHQYYYFNLSFNPNLVSSTDVIFTYNSTQYSTTKYNITVNFTQFDISLLTPHIAISPTNILSSWNVTIHLINGTTTYNNSFIQAQTLESVNISYCQGNEANMVIVLNYTFMDEENNTILESNITLPTLSAEANFITYQNNIEANNSFLLGKITNKSNFKICMSPPYLSVKLDGQIKYDGNGYNSRDYYYRNYTVDNITDNVGLYLLDSTRASAITFIVTDPDDIEIEDAIINIKRYDVGNNTLRTVAMGKTNLEGKDLIYLRKNDVFYSILITQSDGTLSVFPNQKIISDEVNIKITSGTLADILETFNNAEKDIVVAGKTFYAYYNDSSNMIQEGCFSIQKVSLLNNSFVYYNCISDSKGSWVYTVDNESAVFQAAITLEINPKTSIIQKIVDFTTKALWNTLGSKTALFIAFMISLSLIGFGLLSPAAAVIISLFTTIFFFALGLTPMGIGTLISFIIIGVLLLRKLNE